MNNKLCDYCNNIATRRLYSNTKHYWEEFVCEDCYGTHNGNEEYLLEKDLIQLNTHIGIIQKGKTIKTNDNIEYYIKDIYYDQSNLDHTIMYYIKNIKRNTISPTVVCSLKDFY